MTVPRYNTCTIFSKGVKDPFTGFETLGESRSYKCEVARGGKTKYADNKGVEFYPASTFWVRESDLIDGTHSEPKDGEMIVKGTDKAMAEIIRSVMVHDNTKFGESESYTIGTNA